jgi:FkbM family methyltransferase
MSLAATRDYVKLVLTRYPRVYDALRRPYSVARFWLRRPHDSDYEVFALFPDRQGEFLDVGANAGMSALSFRIYNKTNPIVSIEPNPFHERDLEFVSRLAKPMEFHIWAAGREDGRMHLNVPVYRGVPLTAEGSLRWGDISASSSLEAQLGARMSSQQFEIARVEVPVRTLDSLNLNPAFVKLDVQGFEREALAGLETTLRRSRPVLLVEAPDQEVRGFLSGLGYEALSYLVGEHRLAPEISGRPNTVFVPRP